MQVYWSFYYSNQRGIFEIESTIPFDILSNVPFHIEELPCLNSIFRIVHGKKKADAIRYHESAVSFYSEKIRDILHDFVDIDKYMYPIKINGIHERYYFIHNLPEVAFLNRSRKNGEKPCFLLEKDMPPFFTLQSTRYYICNSKIKDALTRANLTNIDFTTLYGYTQDEWDLHQQILPES